MHASTSRVPRHHRNLPFALLHATWCFRIWAQSTCLALPTRSSPRSPNCPRRALKHTRIQLNKKHGFRERANRSLNRSKMTCDSRLRHVQPTDSEETALTPILCEQQTQASIEQSYTCTTRAIDYCRLQDDVRIRIHLLWLKATTDDLACSPPPAIKKNSKHRKPVRQMLPIFRCNAARLHV